MANIPSDMIRDYMRKMGRPLPPPQRALEAAPPSSSPRPKAGSAEGSDLARRWLASWRLLGHPEPVAEHPFCPGRKWRFDFAWPDGGAKVAVEIHGGIHARGRHTRGGGFAADREKVYTAQELGWLVYEVTDVRDTRLMDRIARQIEMRRNVR